MKKQSTLTQVKDALAGVADTVGVSKGQIVARRGFFFSSGMNSEKFGAAVIATLQRANIAGVSFKLAGVNEQWKAFNGTHTVAQGSHWAARVDIIPQES